MALSPEKLQVSFTAASVAPGHDVVLCETPLWAEENWQALLVKIHTLRQ